MIWRWDQGRLQYFEFDHLKKIAAVLVKLDGVNLDVGEDPLRDLLVKEVGLPFAPKDYMVLRNYKRVFEVALLASTDQTQLVCTDVALALSENSGSYTFNDYFSTVAKRFCYPFPSFIGYDPGVAPVFPFCAIIKFLIARHKTDQSPAATPREVINFLIANNVTGAEDVAYYEALKESHLIDEPASLERQVREMMIFISQHQMLSWRKNIGLYIDTNLKNEAVLLGAIEQAKPDEINLVENRITQIKQVATPQEDKWTVTEQSEWIEPEQVERTFFEGKKVRKTHVRTERNPRIRREYFEQNPRPEQCHVCYVNGFEYSPWTENILELHHLLPLSSPIKQEDKGTSFSDLVPLCPTCHRAIHMWYRLWLKDQNIDDFRSHDEARMIYEEGRQALISHRHDMEE